eukprot:Hpha_TRINITY_DN32407_c0_g1::TRINITY_DN32407_c0_g1_i1::g.30865::m.30865
MMRMAFAAASRGMFARPVVMDSDAVQRRSFFHATRPLYLEPNQARRTIKHNSIAPPWAMRTIHEPRAETRFRLVGPPWSQTMVHLSHGIGGKHERHSKYQLLQKHRWRRLKDGWQKKYRKHLLPYSINGVLFAGNHDTQQYNIC